MHSNSKFLLGFPSLLNEFWRNNLSDEIVFDYIMAIHDGLLRLLEKEAIRKHPDWDGPRINKCARHFLLNVLLQPPSTTDQDILNIHNILYQFLFGDLEKANFAAREWFATLFSIGAYKYSMKKLSAYAEMGEKFIESAGHVTKTENTKLRQANIAQEYQKLIADGIERSIVHYRIENKYGIGVRQLQRIIKRSKTT